MKSSTLQRRTPLARKRSTPRRRREATPRCTWVAVARCRRAATVPAGEDLFCRQHARKEADRLVGLLVKNRDGWTCQHLDCGATHHTATLDWAHIEGRYVNPFVRWDLDAATTLCRPCHERFTANPTAWHVYVARRWPGRLELLRDRGRAGERSGYSPDVGAVIVNARLQLGRAA